MHSLLIAYQGPLGEAKGALCLSLEFGLNCKLPLSQQLDPTVQPLYIFENLDLLPFNLFSRKNAGLHEIVRYLP